MMRRAGLVATFHAMRGATPPMFLRAAVFLFNMWGLSMMITMACGLGGEPRAGFATGLGGACGRFARLAAARLATA